MNQWTLELIGKGRHWNISKPETRMGRDPKGDIALRDDEFPSVSRNHAVLRLEADQWWVEDLNSLGGTFVNGQKVRRARLSPGDVVRLAADGPELRLRAGAALPGSVAAVQPAAAKPAAPTRLYGGAPAAGVATPRGPYDTDDGLPMLDTPGEPAVTHIGPPVPLAAESEIADTPAYPEGAAETKPANVPPLAPEAIPEEKPPALPVSPAAGPLQLASEDQLLMEQKLNALRNLLIVAILLVLALGGICLNQYRLIERNRQEVSNLKKDAVENLLPALDNRLKDLETRLNNAQTVMAGMDGKIKQAEDRFMQRLDRGLPVLLDRYVQQKMKEAQAAAAAQQQH